MCVTRHTQIKTTLELRCVGENTETLCPMLHVLWHTEEHHVRACVFCVYVCACVHACVYVVCVCVSPAHLWLGEHCCLLPTTRL